jgi:hypothetical protein
MSRPFLVSCCIAPLCLATVLLAPCRGQAFVEQIAPPAAERGKTTRVTLNGTQFGRPLDLWTSLPADKLRAKPIRGDATSAVFEVTVAADAPVGICGVRLATVDGLSNVHLFLIDDLPVRPAPVATEGPAKVALPAALWGRFRKAEVDRFAIDVTAGQRVSFEVVGNRFGADIDPLVTLRDARGQWLAEHDNDAGLYVDCRFEHVFAAAGTYVVEVRDARYHGSEHGHYVLRLGRFPAARVALPSVVAPGKRGEVHLPELSGAALTVETPPRGHEGPFFAALRRPGDEGSAWLPLKISPLEPTVEREPNNTLVEATPAKVPGVLCGVLGEPGDRDCFRFDLTKGQKIRLRGQARALNSPADLEIRLADAAGRELRRASNPGEDEVTFDFSAPTAGAYGLTVRDLAHDGGPAFAYRIEVRGGEAQVQVVAEGEGLTVPQSSYQPVVLNATRTDYTGPIKLTLTGAPPGVTLTPDEIPANSTALVCKLSAASSAPVGVYTLRMLAQPAAKPDIPPRLVRTLPLIDRQRVNVDLIPYAPREDQRRLPPALTDRFALQITPPAPFTMELPEPTLTLVRYLHVAVPIVTTRSKAFTGPIAFSARGGQLGDKKEGRTRVYAEFSPATPSQPRVTGGIHTRILVNLGKPRIEVSGTGEHEGRRITLRRTFDLDVKAAFAPTTEPASLMLSPGGSARVRLLAHRVEPFAGDVTVELSRAPDVTLPEKVVIPRGQDSIELAVQVAPDAAPGRHGVQLSSRALVGQYEEEQRGAQLVIEIRKPDAPKKK